MAVPTSRWCQPQGGSGRCPSPAFEKNEKKLVEKATAYLRDFKEAFQGRLGLVANEKKTVVVTDEGPVADALRKSVRHTNVKVESTTRLLGVGFATCRAAGMHVAHQR